MDFGDFNVEPLALDDSDISQENEFGEFGEFRSRCNTWPRHHLQQDLFRGHTRVVRQKSNFQNVLESAEDLLDFTNPDQFDSTSGLNFQQLPLFNSSSRFPNAQTTFSHVNSVGSPGTANPAAGMNNVLPLVSEEDFLDDLNALSNEIESSLNMVIPDSGLDMDITPFNETTTDDPTGFAAPTSPPELQSPKQKPNNPRRNPWGNNSYADLITQAIQNAPDQRLTLAQIYDWLSKNVQYFREKSDNVNSIGWKNSIRHNLSLHSKFVRVQSDGAGKSSWWTLDPEFSKQTNQNQKPIRRRAQTLESASLQSIRPGRRGRGSSANPGYRKRDVSGCSTPLHGRRPSMSQLDRAVSSQSLSYPESPGLFGHPQLSPEYPHPGNSAFSGPIRTRTLSNGSLCTGSTTIGGRLSPFRPRASSAFSLESYKSSSSPTWVCASPDTQEQTSLKPGPVGLDDNDKDADFNDAIQIITSDLNLMGMPNLNFQPPLNDRAIRNSGHEIGAVDPHQRRTNPEPHSFYAKKNEEQIPSFKIKILEPRDQSLTYETSIIWPTNRYQYLTTQQRLLDENGLKLSTSLPNEAVPNYGLFEDTRTKLPELLQEDLNFLLDSKPAVGQSTNYYEESLVRDSVGQVSTSSGFYKLANNSSSNLLSLQS